MPFMKRLLIIFSVFQASGLSAQIPLDADSIFFSSKLKTIVKNSNTTIAYRESSYWNQFSPWNILTIDQTNTIHKYKADQNLENIKKLEIDLDSLKKEAELFIQYDIFNLKMTQGWFATCDSCKGGISDAKEYSFLVLTKSEYFNLYFYEPDFHITCCSKLFGHEKLITLIKKLFPK